MLWCEEAGEQEPEPLDPSAPADQGRGGRPESTRLPSDGLGAWQQRSGELGADTEMDGVSDAAVERPENSSRAHEGDGDEGSGRGSSSLCTLLLLRLWCSSGISLCGRANFCGVRPLPCPESTRCKKPGGNKPSRLFARAYPG